MKCRYLVFDYGTTALKAVGYDGEFRPLAVAAREWTYSYPAPGFIEYPARLYWEKTVEAAREVLEKSGGADELRCVSVTGQSETLIPVDGRGEPLGDAIVWLDTRAQEEFAEMERAVDLDRLYARTGNTALDPVMPLLKLRWMKKNDPARYGAAKKMLLLRDYIFYKLSGEMTAEHTISCCSGYFDIVSCRWDEELLRLAGIESEKLPELTDSRYIARRVTDEARALIGLGDGVKAVAGLLDQCASAMGSGNVAPGSISETTGTVLAIAATMPEFKPESMPEKVLMFRHGAKDRFMALPNCPTAGVLLTWFRDNLLSDAERALGFDAINREVEKRLGKENGPILLPHFCGRLSPVNCPSAKGVLYGLTLDCDRYDVARAVMEGVAHLLRENLELLEKIGVASNEIISLGGAAKSKVWQRIKADVCGRSMVTLEEMESTALGCALNAALALGDLKDESEIPPFIRRRSLTRPDEAARARCDERYRAYQRLNKKLGFDTNDEVI